MGTIERVADIPRSDKLVKLTVNFGDHKVGVIKVMRSDPMSEHLFVYGTLMDPVVQRRVIGRTVAGKGDTLIGYSKHSVQLGTGVYPIIRPQTGRSVRGMVIKVSWAELKLIDRYESDAYQRKRVLLVSGQQAWVYSVAREPEKSNFVGRLSGAARDQ